MIAALLLFVVIAGATAIVWNRFFTRVPWPIVAAIFLAIALYKGETLFTRKVDVPGGLAFVAYPWKALGKPISHANTGIALTEMIPWSETARQILKSGEMPLWNRRLGCGSPLLSDQQSAIFHPFTLAGLWLPIGKAWTLSVALRLFFALFFMAAVLKQWELGDGAALFGAIAYGFSTFHVVWLTISIGLTAMMLPFALAAAFEVLRRPRVAAFAALTLALAMTILAGHPETTAFVALTTAAYALYVRGRIAVAAMAAIAALLLTTWFWLPTLRQLPLSERYQLMSWLARNPPKHHIGAPWLLTLVSPDILGTAPGDSYRPPEPRSPDLLDDYGEIASSYSGLATLALAIAAIPIAWRRRPGAFAIGVMAVALIAITEVGQPLIRHVPILNVALLQRLRFLWNLGVVLLAAIALDARRRIAIPAAAVAALLVVAFAIAPHHDSSSFERAQLVAPIVVLGLALAFVRRPAAVAALTFAELVFVTWRYNPPVPARDLLPKTGAIRAMLAESAPSRMVALGWSFLPDIPGYYGLEDVKTTDPLGSPEYSRLFRGYFATGAEFEQVVHATHYPFCDFVNVRSFFVPPGGEPLRGDLQLVYSSADGSVYRNPRALPRYFVVPRFEVEPSFGMTVGKLKLVSDFRQRALVDRAPTNVRFGSGGDLRVVRYGSNGEELEIDSRDGWNLVVSSDTWWPGWRGWWNGRRVPTVRVNGAFVGVFVPPGRGRLRLAYRPAELELGMGIAAFTLVALIVAAGVTTWRGGGPILAE
jgi:hypothetical protein